MREIIGGVAAVFLALSLLYVGHRVGQNSIVDNCAKNGIVVVSDSVLRCVPLIYEGLPQQ